MPLVASFRGTGPLRSTNQHRTWGSRARSTLRRVPAPEADAVPATGAARPAETYLCDFYDNIWFSPENQPDILTRVATATGVRTTRRRRNRPEQSRLIDISQVAYVLTTELDYRSEYPPFSNTHTNIWASPRSILVPEGEGGDSMQGMVSPIQSQRRIFAPQSAPVLRSSMIAEDTAPSDDEDEDDNCHSSQPEDEPPTEEERPVEQSPEQDNDESSHISASNQELLRRTSSLMIGTDIAIPPPVTAHGSTIFSSVFRQRNEWSWSSRFLLGIHEPIRHALYVMDRFIEQSHRQQNVETLQTHVKEFFKWFKTHFVEYVTSQFQAKDTVLLPLVELRASTKAEIRQSYKEIEGMLKALVGQERDLVKAQRGTGPPVSQERSAWLLRLNTLQKSIRRLNLAIGSVLNLEESTLNAAMSSAFTEKRFKDTIMPRLFHAIKNKKIVVPWIVERSKVWGGDAEQKVFQGMMSTTSRFMYKRLWRPYYKTEVAVALHNLAEFDTTVERRDSFFDALHGPVSS